MDTGKLWCRQMEITGCSLLTGSCVLLTSCRLQEFVHTKVELVSSFMLMHLVMHLAVHRDWQVSAMEQCDGWKGCNGVGRCAVKERHPRLGILPKSCWGQAQVFSKREVSLPWDASVFSSVPQWSPVGGKFQQALGLAGAGLWTWLCHL